MKKICQRTEQLQECIAKHYFTNSQNFLAWKNGITIKTARKIAERYYPINRQFPLALASVISKTIDLDERLLLIENLYEEHGKLNKSDDHTILFGNFVKAIGLKPDNILSKEMHPVTNELLDYFKLSCFEANENLAGISFLFSFESHFSIICKAISDGLKLKNKIVEDDYNFFTIHGECDVEHAKKLNQILAHIDVSDKEWLNILKQIETSSKLIFNLFDSIK